MYFNHCASIYVTIGTHVELLYNQVVSGNFDSYHANVLIAKIGYSSVSEENPQRKGKKQLGVMDFKLIVFHNLNDISLVISLGTVVYS